MLLETNSYRSILKAGRRTLRFFFVLFLGSLASPPFPFRFLSPRLVLGATMSMFGSSMLSSATTRMSAKKRQRQVAKRSADSKGALGSTLSGRQKLSCSPSAPHNTKVGVRLDRCTLLPDGSDIRETFKEIKIRNPRQQVLPQPLGKPFDARISVLCHF